MGYGNNTIPQQLQFLLSSFLYFFFPAREIDIIQNSSTGLLSAKSEQGQLFLSSSRRWKKQTTNGQ